MATECCCCCRCRCCCGFCSCCCCCLLLLTLLVLLWENTAIARNHGSRNLEGANKYIHILPPNHMVAELGCRSTQPDPWKSGWSTFFQIPAGVPPRLSGETGGLRKRLAPRRRVRSRFPSGGQDDGFHDERSRGVGARRLFGVTPFGTSFASDFNAIDASSMRVSSKSKTTRRQLRVPFKIWKHWWERLKPNGLSLSSKMLRTIPLVGVLQTKKTHCHSVLRMATNRHQQSLSPNFTKQRTGINFHKTPQTPLNKARQQLNQTRPLGKPVIPK